MTWPRAALLALALVALAGACSDADGDRSAGTTSTTSASTTTSATTTSSVPSSSTTVIGPAACVGPPPAIPTGAAIGPVPDVDGDGRPDRGFFGVDASGKRVVGLLPAAGGGAAFTIDSASPVAGSMLVVNTDEQGPVELLVSDGRGVHLLAFVDCSIVPVTNPQGEPYLFDLQDLRGHGTGVGCVDTPDGRRLVGLLRDPESTGDTVRWTRTIVELDGTHAANGATTSGTFTSPADDASIALLDTVSCGDLTIEHDGIHEPPG